MQGAQPINSTTSNTAVDVDCEWRVPTVSIQMQVLSTYQQLKSTTLLNLGVTHGSVLGRLNWNDSGIKLSKVQEMEKEARKMSNIVQITDTDVVMDDSTSPSSSSSSPSSYPPSSSSTNIPLPRTFQPKIDTTSRPCSDDFHASQKVNLNFVSFSQRIDHVLYRLQELVFEAGEDCARIAMKTLDTILKNIIENADSTSPKYDKVRELNLSNPKLFDVLARWKTAVGILVAVGFSSNRNEISTTTSSVSSPSSSPPSSSSSSSSSDQSNHRLVMLPQNEDVGLLRRVRQELQDFDVEKALETAALQIKAQENRLKLSQNNQESSSSTVGVSDGVTVQSNQATTSSSSSSSSSPSSASSSSNERFDMSDTIQTHTQSQSYSDVSTSFSIDMVRDALQLLKLETQSHPNETPLNNIYLASLKLIKQLTDKVMEIASKAAAVESSNRSYNSKQINESVTVISNKPAFYSKVGQYFLIIDQLYQSRS
jgi:hypothetical protein